MRVGGLVGSSVALALAALLAAGCVDENGLGPDRSAEPTPSATAPLITRFQPLFPRAGETLTIEGRNFGSRVEVVGVTLNGARARVVAVTDERIVAISPRPGRAATTIVVTVGGRRSLPFGVLAS